jgi:trans-aconitate methyltransferase
MTAYLSNPSVWQESWDRQQEAFLPDREHRFTAMLDAVAAVTTGAPPRLLDLAGGTGSISLRTLARFPGAEITVLDQDPVLLTIAESSLHTFGDRATIVDADLGDPGWRAKLAGDGFDAVLTATALHWLPAERVGTLYAEIREVLRPGGIFANADHMPEPGLPGLSVKLRDQARAEREARYASGASTSWPDLSGPRARRGVEPAGRLARGRAAGGRFHRGRSDLAGRHGRRGGRPALTGQPVQRRKRSNRSEAGNWGMSRAASSM